MICPNCSRENNESAKFCIFCGRILEKEVDTDFDRALDLMNAGDPACINLFLQCANRGNSNGYIALGEIYDFGEIVEEDTRKAFDYYQKGLVMGNQMALFHMGSLCYCGRMGENNRARAFGYLSKYNEIYPDECGGLFDLARCYKNGVGTPVDKEKASQLLLKALDVEPDNTEFIWSYANLLEEEGKSSCVQWYKRGAELGDYNCAYFLGNVLSHGEIMSPDYIEAEKYYQLAIQLADQENEEELEVINLSKNEINIVRAKRQIAMDIEKDNQKLQVLEAAYISLENGAYSMALDQYRALPNATESLFFVTYINSTDIDCDTCDLAIDKMRSALNGIIMRGKKEYVLEANQIEFCRKISKYAAKFTLHIAELNNNKFEEMVAYKTTFNRLGPVGFANNIMTPRYEKLAKMLYDLGDQIDAAFQSENAKKTAKTVWNYGNLHMEYCAAHGSLFEKMDRKSTIRHYQSKIG